MSGVSEGRARRAPMTVSSRGASPAMRGGISVGALLLSVAFLVLLIAAPEQLDAAWAWIRDLPIVLEVLAWIALLPWMLAYLAWQTSWALWLRVVVLAVLLGGVAQSFWHGNRAE